MSVLECCPPGRGCNAPSGAAPCALELCRTAASTHKDAALALKRWSALELAQARGRGEREHRFRRRAFERARDRALIAVALSPEDPGSPPPGSPPPGWRRRRRRRTQAARS